MAGTTTSSRQTSVVGSEDRDLTVNFNALVDDVEALRAALSALLVKLDADTGLDESDYESTLDVPAATLTGAKVGDINGDAITS